MTGRDFRHALQDMLDAIDGIAAAIDGKSFDDYRTQWLLTRGIERGIEIISEASRSVPDEVKALRPEVPWQKIRAIGNVLRHEYHGLSHSIMWGVVQYELPALRSAVVALLEGLHGADIR